jgi:hypothetical protein
VAAAVRDGNIPRSASTASIRAFFTPEPYRRAANQPQNAAHYRFLTSLSIGLFA